MTQASPAFPSRESFCGLIFAAGCILALTLPFGAAAAEQKQASSHQVAAAGQVTSPWRGTLKHLNTPRQTDIRFFNDYENIVPLGKYIDDIRPLDITDRQRESLAQTSGKVQCHIGMTGAEFSDSRGFHVGAAGLIDAGEFGASSQRSYDFVALTCHQYWNIKMWEMTGCVFRPVLTFRKTDPFKQRDVRPSNIFGEAFPLFFSKIAKEDSCSSYKTIFDDNDTRSEYAYVMIGGHASAKYATFDEQIPEKLPHAKQRKRRVFLTSVHQSPDKILGRYFDEITAPPPCEAHLIDGILKHGCSSQNNSSGGALVYFSETKQNWVVIGRHVADTPGPETGEKFDPRRGNYNRAVPVTKRMHDKLRRLIDQIEGR